MGVDVGTYRARIGCFHGGRSQPISLVESPTHDSVKTTLILKTLPDFLEFLKTKYDVTVANNMELCRLIENLGMRWQHVYDNPYGIPVFSAEDMYCTGYPANVIEILLQLSGQVELNPGPRTSSDQVNYRFNTIAITRSNKV